jgi:hypothetical protein
MIYELKLLPFEELLETCEEWRGKVFSVVVVMMMMMMMMMMMI